MVVGMELERGLLLGIGMEGEGGEGSMMKKPLKIQHEVRKTTWH